MSDLVNRMAFLRATDALKELRRANWIYSRARQESVAEHSWHALLLAMLLADAAPDGIDHDRVRDLLVVHDLVEVYAGDTPIWDDAARRDESSREIAAGEQLMALLPVDVLPRFDPLWREFQTQESAEARFARAIDTLHPPLMSWSAGGHGHSNGEITPAKLIARKRPTIEAYPVLWGLLLWTVQGAVDRGVLPADDVVTGGSGDGSSGSDAAGMFRDRLAFLLATDRLKEETRANLILSQPRRETVAEHCWHVSLLEMLFADCAPVGADRNRVANLLIVHDLVEVYAGDTSIDDVAGQQTVAEREAEAAERLLRLLPPAPRARFAALIDEFQGQATREARYARALDTLHPTLLTWIEGAHVHPDHENAPASASVVVERKRVMLEDYPELWSLLNAIAQGAVDRGVLPPDEQFPLRGG